MKAAIFIDGQNFYAGWRDVGQGRRIDFSLMSTFLMNKASCENLWGAHYYTGVDSIQTEGVDSGAQKLLNFLDVLETQPGYFVHRFPRRYHRSKCNSCNEEMKIHHDAELQTSLVADMVRYAAMDAYDSLILVSGGTDYIPALKTVSQMGKQTFLASWNEAALSHRLKRLAYAHLDLFSGIDAFLRDGDSDDVLDGPEQVEEDYDATMNTFIDELRMAEEKFNGGYVGLGYFVTKWRSSQLTPSPEIRRKIVEDLVVEGRLELYEASDGAQAIRAL